MPLTDDEREDQDERIHEAWQRLALELTTLSVDTAIVHAASHKWPLYALENYEQKLNGIVDWANQQRDEIHGFAEAHDGEEDSEGS